MNQPKTEVEYTRKIKKPSVTEVHLYPATSRNMSNADNIFADDKTGDFAKILDECGIDGIYRDIVEMHIIYGMSFTEIGHKFGMGKGFAAKRWVTAIRRLAKCSSDGTGYFNEDKK